MKVKGEAAARRDGRIDALEAKLADLESRLSCLEALPLRFEKGRLTPVRCVHDWTESTIYPTVCRSCGRRPGEL